MFTSFTGAFAAGRRSVVESGIQPVEDVYFYYDPSYSYTGTGTTLTDLSGNGRDAVISGSPSYTPMIGPVPPTPEIGGYFTFDGTNDYIASPNVYNLGNANHTVEIWLRPSAVNVNLWSDTGSTSPNTGYHAAGGQLMSVGPFQQYLTSVYVQSTGVQRVVAAAGTFTNNWQQVVRTYNGSTLTGYVNGAAGSPATYTWYKPWQQTANTWHMLFGANETTTYGGSTANYFSGRIGVIRFYNRALTATEVLQNYDATKTQYGLT